MTRPLVVLAVGSALAGFLGVPAFLGRDVLPNYFEEYLSPLLHVREAGPAVIAVPTEAGAALVALLVSLGGIVIAWMMYGRRPLAAAVPEPVGLARVVKNKFYVDEAIETVVLRPYYRLCRVAAAIDEKLVDGLVNAAGTATDLASEMLRLAQTGYVRNYAFMFFLGTILILLYVLR